MNSLGKNLRLTTFGESHGPAMGGIIDGFPPGFKIDFELLQEEIDKRRPGSSGLVTQRKEEDKPEFLSGITSEGITLGTPIGFIIRNKDQHSRDYADMSDIYRPNHADYTYEARYGLRDYRGGGRSSARETVNWVVAGALACQWLATKGIKIESVLTAAGQKDYNQLKEKLIQSPHSQPSLQIPQEIQKAFEEEIMRAKREGDSVGGRVTCLINGLPAGLGNPVFSKFHASLAQAMMSINAAKAFEYGVGKEAPMFSGIQSADIFFTDTDKTIKTKTNFSGGIQGGITNGMPIFFDVTFKPTPTVLQELETVNSAGNKVTLKAKGRHDPCVAVRAVPVVKALAALVTMDFLIPSTEAYPII